MQGTSPLLSLSLPSILCIGFPLPYLAMISHSVNVPGFLSLLCKYWLFIFLCSELSSGNFIYFHRFNYRTLQSHISNGLVISPPFSEIFGTSLPLPLHHELGFHPTWVSILDGPSPTSHVFHDLPIPPQPPTPVVIPCNFLWTENSLPSEWLI